MMRRPSIGLLGRILAVLLIIAATEFAANTFFFERANQFALRDDEAYRVAEHLVIARRALDRTAPQARAAAAKEFTTASFTIAWPAGRQEPAGRIDLGRLREQVLEFEPELLQSKLSVHLQPLRHGAAIAGTMELSDRSMVHFHMTQSSQVWGLTFGSLLTLIAPTLALVVAGMLMIRAAFRPLSMLMKATSHVGTDGHEQVPEQGPSEVRNLIHAFNAMHARIRLLLSSRTQSLVAVCHDLRTPLSRLRLRIDGAELPEETGRAMREDIEELSGLLRSLQDYLSAQSAGEQPQQIDLAAMASTIIDNARDQGHNASIYGPEHLVVSARPTTLRRALNNLVDNALHYGGNVRLVLKSTDQEAVIRIEDDGPGIPDEMLGEVLQPFVRMDGARKRNTHGMGLGLAIAHDAIQLEGGSLTLSNQTGGGLCATVQLPLRKSDGAPV